MWGDNMKYTRYDWKKKKNKGGDIGKVIIVFMSMILVAILVATVMGKFIFDKSLKNEPSKDTSNSILINENKDNGENISSQNSLSLAVVQCGVYSQEANANIQRDALREKYNSFSVQDGDKFRVGVFIGDKVKGEEVASKLESEGIKSMVTRYEIGKEDSGAAELAEIVNGYLQIVNKLQEEDVKSVKTEDFKKWTTSLEEPNSKEHIETIKDVKKEISELPEELNKENIEQTYKTIYKALSPFRVN
ncbi:transmembrane protein [Clostridium fallax]|uniref:Sporulation related domain-containing protein n=2 Tax=Clostridium fallax TaxID=1533 RepID=A0A1M4VBM9_9CLOT|nr:hypothetical protein SAMN05443638_10748 [Clostridium fallax]SQB05800.1 transmembrane protein [Clostridium fallax]